MSVRPGRPAPGAVVHLVLPALAAGMGRATGASWLFVLAAVLAVSVVAALLLPLAGVLRSRVVGVTLPPVAVAGEPLAAHVESKVGAGATIALAYRKELLTHWSQRSGRASGTVSARFPRRGEVRAVEARIRCAAPFGLWSWVRHQTVGLDHPTLVGPASTPADRPPLAVTSIDHDGEATVDRRGGGADVRGVRPWADGDAVGWVHWPTTLRTGALAVRDWAPPARPLAVVRVALGLDPEVAAALAMGQVDAALATGSAVRLEVPAAQVTEGAEPPWRSVAVVDRLDAARALATAPLGPEPRRRRVRPERPEGIEDRWLPRVLTAASMLLAACMVLGALQWPRVSTAVALVGIPLLSYLGYRTRHGRRWWITGLTAVAAVAALARFAVATAEVEAAGGLGVLRDPLAELLIALLVIHALDTPKRRNLRFALASSTGLVIYAGALRVDPTFGWWVVAWALTAGAAAASIHRSELADVAELPSADPPRRTATRRAAGLAGGLVAGSLAALALLAVVPVPEGPSRLLAPTRIPVDLPLPSPGVLVNPALAGGGDGGGGGSGGSGGVEAATGTGTVGYFAFSQSFDLRGRGRPDDTVVMRVRAPAPDFWRGQTFSGFDGTTWFADDDIGERRSGPEIVVPPTGIDPITRPGAGDELVQTYFLEQDMPNLVFAAYRPTRIFIDTDVWVRPDGALRADAVLGRGSIYTVVSQRPAVTEAQLRAQGGPRSGPLADVWGQPGNDDYLQVPASTPARVRDLARQITDPHAATLDKVRAIEAWLAANVEYDLNAPVPPVGADAVDHFLFESRLGFCEQIASALAVLLREAGVPTRVVAGYTPGRWDPFAGVWVVEANNAHAWVEVWFPETGWQAFDPTADVPLSGDTLQRGTLGGPIAEAIGRALATGARLLVLVAPVVGLLLAALWLLRRRRRHRRRPVGAAQARFQRLAGRAGVAVHDSDPNPAIAEALAGTRPGSAAAARRAAAALDAAAFGGADPGEADRAVRELADALR